jgi:hypothetical protein
MVVNAEASGDPCLSKVLPSIGMLCIWKHRAAASLQDIAAALLAACGTSVEPKSAVSWILNKVRDEM